jgi:hypothetical protein
MQYIYTVKGKHTYWEKQLATLTSKKLNGLNKITVQYRPEQQGNYEDCIRGCDAV